MNAITPAPVRIIARPKVFGDERITGAVPAGQTVDEMVGALVTQCNIHPLMIPALAVFVVDPESGREARVPYDRWRFTRPRAGKLLLVKAMPQGGGGGGGGKSPIKTIALLAVMVAATVAAPAIFGAVAGGAFIDAGLAIGLTVGQTIAVGTALVGGVLTMVGSALVNALIPTNSQANRGDVTSFSASPISAPAYSVTGTRNRANPYGVIPKVYGRRRVYPLQAARTYSEVVGNDQYLRALFCFGYGPLLIEDISIGNTPITAFAGLEYELRQGFPDDAPTTLLASVREDAYTVSLLSGVWVQRETYSNTDEISVDVGFLRGLTKYESNGSRSAVTISLHIQYRAVGDTVWVDPPINELTGVQDETTFDGASYLAAGSNADVAADDYYGTRPYQHYINHGRGEGRQPFWFTQGYLSVTDNSTSPVRVSSRWTVANGAYEVRIQRVTADATENQTIDSVALTAIRSVTSEHPIAMTGLALLAVRIKASEQLNGPLDTINAICTSILPTWNGTSWDDPTAQRNPAWAFCDVLRGPANKRLLADSVIDLGAIKEWADACAADSPQGEGASWTYDAVHDSRSTVEATLREIAATARARYIQVEGKYSVVRDIPQAVPWQHFTPRNATGFKATRNFLEHPHALRCRFINPDKEWQEDEVLVYSDGYSSANATVFEQVDMLACTSADQAWREGRYHMAAAKLRPATYELSTDVEHLVCRAGDLVKVAWDVPIWGAGTGRITAVTLDGTDVAAVTVDAAFAMEAGQTYNIRVRKVDNTSILLPINAVAGGQTTLTLTTPISVASGPEVGDIVMFGKVGQEAVDLLVKEVQRGDELSARIVLVDAAPAVHNWYSGALPLFESQVSDVVPVEQQVPPPPVISDVWDDRALVDGVAQSRAYVLLEAPGASEVAVSSLEVWYKASGALSWVKQPMYAVGTPIVIDGLPVGQAHSIQVRAVSQYGRTSAWVATTFTPSGGAVRPSDVTGMRVTVLDTTAYLSWDAVTDVDLSYYKVKWHPDTSGATWGSAQELVIKVSGESIQVPALTGTYLVKAYDTGELESENEAFVTNDVSGLASANAIARVTEDPTFPGSMVGVRLVGAGIELGDIGQIDEVVDVDIVANWDVGTGGFADSGTYYFSSSLDLGAVYTSRLYARLSAAGENYANVVDYWSNVDSMSNWDGADPAGWRVELQTRTTNDNPAGTPTWSSWRTFLAGDYSARAFEWRVILYSVEFGITPRITEITVSVDMPDRLASGDNVTCPTGGLTVSFSPPFRATPALATADQDMTTGDYKEITASSASGFSILFRDSSGAPVERTFDWVARGFGYAT